MVDIKDVPRDATLPHLAFAVDGEAMRARLQPFFEDANLLQVKVERFTYKPGRNARIAYKIKLRGRQDGVKARHVLHGRMEAPGEAAAIGRKMARRTWMKPAYGPAFLCLEDLGLVLWGFPNDPKLEGIASVAGEGALRRAAAGIPALQRFASGDCESTVVKFVPGKRLVMKHKLVAADGETTLLYSKTYGHERGGAIHDVMRALWDRGDADPDAFASPEPVAALDGGRTLLLRALPGTAAIRTLQDGALGDGMRRAGAGLARIHTSGVQGLEPWTAAHELENFMRVTSMLQRYDPELAPAVERLRGLAESGLERLEPGRQVPIHGAFRFTQLLTWRGRLALVDFDGFKQGGPMCDAGSFVAHLYYLEAKGELDAVDRARAVATFLEAYRARTPWGTPAAALGWYTSVLLVAKHVQKCVKRLKDDGDAKMQVMLSHAEDLLAGRAGLA